MGHSEPLFVTHKFKSVNLLYVDEELERSILAFGFRSLWVKRLSTVEQYSLKSIVIVTSLKI